MAVGQSSSSNSSYLYRQNNLPTNGTSTLCGYYYHSKIPPSYGILASTRYNSWMDTGIETQYASNDVYVYTENGAPATAIRTLNEGHWYFWSIRINDTQVTATVDPIGSNVQTGVGSYFTRNSVNTFDDVMLLNDGANILYPAVGYHAYVRCWDALLSDSELNAERVSPFAVKSSPLFDAPLFDTNNMGGFAISGTLWNMRQPPIVDPWSVSIATGFPTGSVKETWATGPVISPFFNVAADQALLVIGNTENNATSTLTDNQGGSITWTKILSGGVGSAHKDWWYAYPGTALTNVAVSMTDDGAVYPNWVQVFALNGASAAPPTNFRGDNGADWTVTATAILSGVSSNSLGIAQGVYTQAGTQPVVTYTPATLWSKNDSTTYEATSWLQANGLFVNQTATFSASGFNGSSIWQYLAAEVKSAQGFALDSLATGTVYNNDYVSLTMSTTAANLLVAVHTVYSPYSVSISGGGDWTLRITGTNPMDNYSNVRIWTAPVTSQLSAIPISVSKSLGGTHNLTVQAFRSAVIGASASYGDENGVSVMSATIQPIGTGSYIIGGFCLGDLMNVQAVPILAAKNSLIYDPTWIVGGVQFSAMSTTTVGTGAFGFGSSDAAIGSTRFGVAALEIMPLAPTSDPRHHGLYLISGSFGGRKSTVRLYFTWDGAKHSPSSVSYPTVGVGQATAGANYLSRATNLPTYDNCTVCGHFYYSGTSGNYQVIASYLNTSNYTFLGVGNGTNISLVYSQNSGAPDGPTLVAGTWYFWAMTQNAGALNVYLNPSNVPITGTTWTAMSYNTGFAPVTHYLLAYSGGGTTVGYEARVRAWSSILTIAELNAERGSATAVKAGSVWDAPFDTISSLGGYSINGTLNTGP